MKEDTRLLNRSISSDLGMVDAVCEDARNLLECHDHGGQCFAVELLMREFINNAIIHGNCRDFRKRVDVTVRIGRKWIDLTIADEGAGFNWRTARRTPSDENATSGRGLAIGALYAHRMRFNRQGNRVTLRINKNEFMTKGEQDNGF